MDKYKVGVIGATSDEGIELIRILLKHPIVELAAVSSQEGMGRALSEICASLSGRCDKIIVSRDEVLAKSDIVFFAERGCDSHELAAQCIKSKCVFIDMSTTFRLTSEEMYSQWYAGKYGYPELHEAAAYGLPELLRDKISGKVIVAVPGAIATAACIALAPALYEGLVQPDGIIIDAKCARDADAATAISDCLPTMSFPHIETPEIERILTLAAGKPVRLTVNTHTIPVRRGVMVTCYAKGVLSSSAKTLYNILQRMYSDEEFIRILPLGAAPSIADVEHTNMCEISAAFDDRSGTAIITAVLDDLIKGSAGQAVQNMNALLSMPEDIGVVRAES